MAHKTHLISRKNLMMKSKDRKCYMYLKFHINQPYIVYVINWFSLTLSFFREYTSTKMALSTVFCFRIVQNSWTLLPRDENIDCF